MDVIPSVSNIVVGVRQMLLDGLVSHVLGVAAFHLNVTFAQLLQSINTLFHPDCLFLELSCPVFPPRWLVFKVHSLNPVSWPAPE